jgi:hypothetical protein
MANTVTAYLAQFVINQAAQFPAVSVVCVCMCYLGPAST